MSAAWQIFNQGTSTTYYVLKPSRNVDNVVSCAFFYEPHLPVCRREASRILRNVPMVSWKVCSVAPVPRYYADIVETNSGVNEWTTRITKAKHLKCWVCKYKGTRLRPSLREILFQEDILRPVQLTVTVSTTQFNNTEEIGMRAFWEIVPCGAEWS